MGFRGGVVVGILIAVFFFGSFHCSGCTAGVLPRGSTWVVCR